MTKAKTATGNSTRVSARQPKHEAVLLLQQLYNRVPLMTSTVAD
jgi:hypothetical protein